VLTVIPGIKRVFYSSGKAIHRKPAAISAIAGDIVDYAGHAANSLTNENKRLQWIHLPTISHA
jgi:hypothetical protein